MKNDRRKRGDYVCLALLRCEFCLLAIGSKPPGELNTILFHNDNIYIKHISMCELIAWSFIQELIFN